MCPSVCGWSAVLILKVVPYNLKNPKVTKKNLATTSDNGLWHAMDYSYALYKPFSHLLSSKEVSKENKIVKFGQMIYHHQNRGIAAGVGYPLLLSDSSRIKPLDNDRSRWSGSNAATHFGECHCARAGCSQLTWLKLPCAHHLPLSSQPIILHLG